MTIRKIMCACGAGLGSSLIVHMHTEEVLKKLQVSDILVDHTTFSQINPSEADLFIVSAHLDDGENVLPQDKKIVLINMLSKRELEEKLAEKLLYA